MLTMEQIMLEVSKELIKVVENHIDPAFEKIFRKLDTLEHKVDKVEIDMIEVKNDVAELKNAFVEFKMDIQPRVKNQEKDLYTLEKRFEEYRRYWRLKSMHLDNERK